MAVRITMVPSLCLVLAACGGGEREARADAGTDTKSVLQADARSGAGEHSCQRDADCDGVAATCDPAEHVCLMRCPGIVLDGPAALAAARRCREIEGDVFLRASTLLTITGDDLPYLERITGSLISAGGKPLRELSLPALRELGTTGTESILEVILDNESLIKVAFPALRVVHGSLGMFGLNALRELDLGALEHVEKSFALTTLPRLTTLTLHPALEVGETLQLQYLCSLPAEMLVAPAADVKAVGCCTEQPLACENTLQCQCQNQPPEE